MYPSTESEGHENHFAAEVLRELLRRIESRNAVEGSRTFLVSHAWTDGPMIYVVFKAPPSDKTWGLARDTRHSIIDPGPWPDLDEAASYYYLLDFEENWPGRFSRQPGEPDTIHWFGDRNAGLPERPSDTSEAHRYTPSTDVLFCEPRPGTDRPPGNEPRRYADPQ